MGRVRALGGATWSALLLAMMLALAACGRPDGAAMASSAPASDDDRATGGVEEVEQRRVVDGDDGPATSPDRPGDATAAAGSPDDATRSMGERPGESPRREAPGRRLTIAAVGDVLPHGAVVARAAAYGQESGRPFDFRPMFADIAPIIRAADLAICNLESPLAKDHAAVSHQGFPLFNAPRELGEALADAGFDACSTANNHATDAGAAGVVATLQVLDEVGIAGAGIGRTPQDASAPRWHVVEEVTVAHLAATGWINVALPTGSEWMVELIDVERLVAQAQTARGAGAEVVVVSLHHGNEYQLEPSDGQRSRAEALLTSGAVDVVLGHHAHVVQPIERIGDGVVVHGLGNLLSNQRAEVTGPATQDGVVVLLELVEAADGSGFRVSEVAYVPTWVDRDRHVIVDVWDALGSPALGAERRVPLVGSWQRTVAAVTHDGADAWGAVPTSGTGWFVGRGAAGLTQVAGTARDPAVVLTGGP
jgi:poly-gamma-glutamate capsule biosynthesis protein CapA/YwtB (metallophosphatase superfamily)